MLFKSLAVLAALAQVCMAAAPIQLKSAVIQGFSEIDENQFLGYNANTTFISGTIVVDNVEFQKTVKVHLSSNGGAWLDYPATYLQPVNDGSNTELWTFNASVPTQVASTIETGGKYQFALEVVTPDVEPQGVWDNNNGANYQLSFNQLNPDLPDVPVVLGPYVNVALVSQTGAFSHIGPYLEVCAGVRNLAFQKTVNITFSADATKSFTSTFTAPTYYAYSPSSTVDIFCGAVYYSLNIPNAPYDTPYYISYLVNGQTYYDNNNNHNFAYTGGFN